MRYVILRDDDTNTFTPVECLEQLYRPFLDWSLPVNLSVIPNVRTDVTTPDGQPEEFLLGTYRTPGRAVPAAHASRMTRPKVSEREGRMAIRAVCSSPMSRGSPGGRLPVKSTRPSKPSSRMCCRSESA